MIVPTLTLRSIFKTIVLFVSINSLGQEYNLNDFKLDSLPQGENLGRANRSKQHWFIEKVNDSIKITYHKFIEFKGDSLPFSKQEIANRMDNISYYGACKKVKDGYLIGRNGGEFGGSLWFLSQQENLSYQIYSFINIHNIFKFNSKIYATSGTLIIPPKIGQ